MRVSTTVAAAIASALVVPLTVSEASAASPIRFSYVQYDSPGSDGGSNKSLNAEWIRIKNHGTKTRTLTGWTVRDPEGHVFQFPTFKLKPGKSVRIHTGAGSKTSTDLYWGEDWYVWNNSGDKVILKNKAKTTIDTCKWDDGDGNKPC